jgi:hypothetical protein
MSYYKKALDSLKEIKTISAHMTALGKIRASTEDTNLIRAIDDLVHELQEVHTKSKSKSTPLSLDTAKNSKAKALVQYCSNAIGTKKPEWQILAERHGWVPPKA